MKSIVSFSFGRAAVTAGCNKHQHQNQQSVADVSAARDAQLRLLHRPARMTPVIVLSHFMYQWKKMKQDWKQLKNNSRHMQHCAHGVRKKKRRLIKLLTV